VPAAVRTVNSFEINAFARYQIVIMFAEVSMSFVLVAAVVFAHAFAVIDSVNTVYVAFVANIHVQYDLLDYTVNR